MTKAERMLEALRLLQKDCSRGCLGASWSLGGETLAPEVVGRAPSDMLTEAGTPWI